MTGDWLGHRSVSWIVGTLALALFVCANLPWQLDDYDQAKQAYTSFEMVNAGHWIYQHTPHDRVATKPPLVGWISAGLFEVTRSWDVGWRLPSLGATIALAILLFRTGSGYGAFGGLLAMSAFAFNLLTPRLATLVRTDMPLALVISLIGILVWRKLRDPQPWQSRDRVILFLLLTAAMLIKGPIVYAFLIPGILLVCLGTTRGVSLRGCGWWPWLASLGIFLAWAIAGSLWVPNFYDQVVGREFLGRFGETEHRPQPFYFYWPHVLHKFAPWSLLMIALAVIDVRSARWRWREIKMAPETLWLLGWTIGGLVVMSLVPSKRVDRIFPVIPALCLLFSAQMAERRAALQRWALIALVAAILWAGGYAALKVSTGYRDNRDALEMFGRAVRGEAASGGWRYEVASASDEGLLLYLQKLHFVRLESVTSEWNNGNLDGLIVPERDAANAVAQLNNAAVSDIKSDRRKDPRGNYVLIKRRN